MADTNDMKHTEIEDNKPDIKLVRALQKDFNALYVSQFTTAWKENRLIRTMKTEGVTYKGELLGDYKLTIEKLPSQNKDADNETV